MKNFYVFYIMCHRTLYASACLIIILIFQLFLCLLLYSYYSSIRYRCILTKALGCACKGNHVC